MSTIERAIQIAASAHAGATDKGGMPYIFHPIRVMMAVSGTHEKMAAVLHDVVEDTDVTLDMLRDEGFPAEVVSAVGLLTKRKGERYMDFIRRLSCDPVASAVKVADLVDNLDESRLPEIRERDIARLEKYRHALTLLESLRHPDGVRRPSFRAQ